MGGPSDHERHADWPRAADALLVAACNLVARSGLSGGGRARVWSIILETISAVKIKETITLNHCVGVNIFVSGSSTR